MAENKTIKKVSTPEDKAAEMDKAREYTNTLVEKALKAEAILQHIRKNKLIKYLQLQLLQVPKQHYF